MKQTLLSLASGGVPSPERVGGLLSTGVALGVSLGSGSDLGLDVDPMKQQPVVICIPLFRDLEVKGLKTQKTPSLHTFWLPPARMCTQGLAPSQGSTLTLHCQEEVWLSTSISGLWV